VILAQTGPSYCPGGIQTPCQALSEGGRRSPVCPDYEASWNWTLCLCQEVPLVGCVLVDPGLVVLLVVLLGGEECQTPSSSR